VASRSSCRLYDSMISETSLILAGPSLRTGTECYSVVTINRHNRAIVLIRSVDRVSRLLVIPW
jgi:hypothetical protein